MEVLEHYLPMIYLGLGLLALWLIQQRWLWLMVLGLGGLASCFAMLASIIHFQILAALGLFVLMVVLWSIGWKILEDSDYV
ncbi:hypothetical protein QP938_08670 [Porticoccaceae bacterium LTM1]|nr:hypothetical protein QP938_08670 [Porticoccaceae bacterium LTM1]